jgi:hypothetical protein
MIIDIKAPRTVAAIAALICLESVARVTERKDVFSTAFFLSGLCMLTCVT